MGAFHEGHLSLMRAARAEADVVVVSLFVNPAQFGPTEDLAAYPRDFERDRALAEAQGVDLLFAPDVERGLPGRLRHDRRRRRARRAARGPGAAGALRRRRRPSSPSSSTWSGRTSPGSARRTRSRRL